MDDIEVSDICATLKLYKEHSQNPKAHQELLKQKTVLLYSAVNLTSKNVKILNLCLDILDNFVSYEENYYELINTFGIYEALNSLALRIRDNNGRIFQRASEILEILRNYELPKSTNSNVFLLHIADLNLDNKECFEKSLVQIKGIISILMDIQMKRCTLRVFSKYSIKQIIEKIIQVSTLKPLLVKRDVEEGVEVLVDVTEVAGLNRSYFESEVLDLTGNKRNAVTTTSNNFVGKGSTLLKSIANYFSDAFYW